MNDQHPLQSIIDQLVRLDRDRTLRDSPQLTLGEIIDQLEKMPDRTEEVGFVFEYAYPTKLASWRGAYDELALGFNVVLGHNLGEHKPPTVDELLTELKGALGKTYEGWKGGDYVMQRSTPVWVANPGNAGNTGIVGVTERGGEVTLDTAWCGY